LDATFYRSSRTGKPLLRIGLLLDTASLPRWSAEVVDHIVQCDFAAIELLVFNGSARKNTGEAPRPRSLMRKVINTLRNARLRRSFLFILYQRWDRRNADPSTDPVAMVDCTARLAHVESMHVDPITERFVHRFPDDAIERIREKKLDVLIRFGFNILRGKILTAARYGVWSYHHGDNVYYRGGHAYFWEILEGNPVSGAILQVLTEELDAGKVLYKGLFATHAGFSQVRNRVQPYWGASTFMIQKLRELHAHGWDHVERNAVKSAPYEGKKKIYSTPSNVEMLRWLLPLIGKTLRRLVRRPIISHWRIAVRVDAPPIPNSTSLPDMSSFRWVDSPKGRFYADPFVVEADGKHWVYFEDFDYAAQLGKISCAEVRDGGLGEPLTVLERPYHLSYPCVFCDGGTWYMVPETASAGTVELYRCTRFPDLWQFERELLRGSAVDTTVWIENGVYWFFVTFQEPRGMASQLWLYSASSLGGTWTPHPANPISTDVRYARGGGAIFRHEGKLFRPSQDCSGEYGRSMTLNEIVVMDHEQYREEPRVIIDAVWMKDLVGTHTYGRAGAVEIIDGKTRLPADRIL
jgi:folate-dependent phosphoribosylglycinamide formyltransferase PurN